jgi:hypothetical protein
MRFLIAGFALALMMATAQAQIGSGPGNQMGPASQVGGNASRTQQKASEKENEQKVKANDKAYNSALRNLPDKKYDPWGGVR